MPTRADDSPSNATQPVERKPGRGQRQPWIRSAAATAQVGDADLSAAAVDAARRLSVEVFELETGGMPGSFKQRADPIGAFSSEAPLPERGDIVFLPTNRREGAGESRLIGCDVLTPYRVVERERVRPRPQRKAGLQRPAAFSLSDDLDLRPTLGVGVTGPGHDPLRPYSSGRARRLAEATSACEGYRCRLVPEAAIVEDFSAAHIVPMQLGDPHVAGGATGAVVST